MPDATVTAGEPASSSPINLRRAAEAGHWVTLEDGRHVFIREAAGHVPKRLAPEGNRRRFSRAEIERHLLAHHEQVHGGGYTAQMERELEEAAGGGNAFTFHRRLPTEVKEYMAGRPHLRSLFRVTDEPRRAGGADAFGALGDRYFDIAEAKAGNPLRLAKAAARDSQDPEVQFLAAVHDHLPAGSARAATLRPIAAGGLRVGDRFTIGGDHFRVAEDAGGYRVLTGGRDYPAETPVDALREIPIDRDSFRPGKRSAGAAAAAHPSREPIPFSRALPGGGRWVTINGTHVFIRNGKVTKGPPALKRTPEEHAALHKRVRELREAGYGTDLAVARAYKEGLGVPATPAPPPPTTTTPAGDDDRARRVREGIAATHEYTLAEYRERQARPTGYAKAPLGVRAMIDAAHAKAVHEAVAGGETLHPEVAKDYAAKAPVDNNRQFGLIPDASGNHPEIGERPGQANLFAPGKPAVAPAPTEPKAKPQFDPRHTAPLPFAALPPQPQAKGAPTAAAAAAAQPASGKPEFRGLRQYHAWSKQHPDPGRRYEGIVWAADPHEARQRAIRQFGLRKAYDIQDQKNGGIVLKANETTPRELAADAARRAIESRLGPDLGAGPMKRALERIRSSATPNPAASNAAAAALSDHQRLQRRIAELLAEDPDRSYREAFQRAHREHNSARATLSRTAPAAASAEPPHEFSSTQVDLPADLSDAVLSLARQIPDEDLADDGRDASPHVTLKYGLHGDDPAAARAALAGEPPVRVRLGKVSVFPASPDRPGSDVVKLDVESADLHRLNGRVAAAVPHTDTYPEYHPHVTLAYVKPGLGQKYAGRADLEGREATIDRVRFSDRHGRCTDLPLGETGGSQPHRMSRRFYLARTDGPDNARPVPLGLEGYPTHVNLTVGGEPRQLPVSYWEKDVIEPGVYEHPLTHELLVVTDDDIDQFVHKFNLMRAAGIEVPTPVDHSQAAEANRGFVVRARRVGRKLRLTHQAIGEDAAVLAARNRASICIDPDFVDERGRRWGKCFVHSAYTPLPVISGQGPFLPAASAADPPNEPIPERFAASRAAQAGPDVYYLSSSAPRCNDMTEKQLQEARELLGVPDLSEADAVPTLLSAARVLADDCQAHKQAADTARQELSRAQTERDQARTELSRAPKPAAAVDDEVLADRADSMSDLIDGRVAKGELPREVATKLKAQLRPEGGRPNQFLLSRHAGMDTTVVKWALGLFDGLRLNPLADADDKSGVQHLSRATPDPDGKSPENDGKGKKEDDTLVQTAERMYGKKS
jgi:2'-5' RNA ligase